MTKVLAPISIGELVDKITILEIKLGHALTAGQRRNIDFELDNLVRLIEPSWAPSLRDLKQSLSEINLQIWNEEDAIRKMHIAKEYDEKFVDSAISIFTLNDQRASLKRLINDRLESDIVEEKIYDAAKTRGQN